MLKLDLSKVSPFLPQDYVTSRQAKLEKAASMLSMPQRTWRRIYRLGGPAPGL